MRTAVVLFLALLALSSVLLPGARAASAAGVIDIAAGSAHACAITTLAVTASFCFQKIAPMAVDRCLT